MAWNVSDSSTAGANNANLDSFNTTKYHDVNGWRLTKNIAWINPTSQKTQQALDLDTHLITDFKTLHGSRSFNGFGFKTSAPLSVYSTSNGPDGNSGEDYTYTTSTVYSKTVSQSANFWTLPAPGDSNVPSWIIPLSSSDFTYNSDQNYKQYTSKLSVINNDGCYGFIANTNGAVGAGLYDHRGHDDGLAIFVNGVLKGDQDPDGTTAIIDQIPFNSGDLVVVKFCHYGSRTSYSNAGVENDSGDNDKRYIYISTNSITEPVPQRGRTSYFSSYCPANGSWTNISGGPSVHPAALVGIARGGTVIPTGGDGSATSVCDPGHAIYVNGELRTYVNTNSSSTDLATLNLENGDVVVDVVTELLGRTPATYIEDEIRYLLGHNADMSADTSNGTHNYGSTYGGYRNSYLDRLTAEPTSSVTLTGTTTSYRTRKTSSGGSTTIVVGQKINRCPSKEIKSPSYYENNAGTFICPKGNTYRSTGYFVAAQSGTLTVNMTGYYHKIYTSYDSYSWVVTSGSIYKNGSLIDSFSASGSDGTKSDKTFTVNVSAGDFIKINFSKGIGGSYTANFTGEYAENLYVPVGEETSFVEYRPSYKSSVSSSSESAFKATTSGTLTVKYNEGDYTQTTTNVSGDSQIVVFKNGKNVMSFDDGSGSNSIQVVAGDVIVIRTGRHSVGGSYVKAEYDWDFPGAEYEWSFSGSSTTVFSNHTLSWREMLRNVLKEARALVEENGLSDYAFPFAIIDDANNATRLNEAYIEIYNSKLFFDLYIYANTLPESKLTSLCKGFNFYADSSVSINLNNFFKNNSVIKWTDIEVFKGQGIQAFYNCDNLLEVTCSGASEANFTEAFANCDKLNSVSTFYLDGANWTKALSNCPSLKSLIVNCIGVRDNNITRLCEGSYNIEKLVFYNGGQKWFMDYAFTNNSKISPANGSIIQPYIGDEMGSCKYTFKGLYKMVPNHDYIKTYFGKHYQNWQNAVNDYRTTFFNCPYNGTILEEIMSYDEQKAVGFKPEKLMYEALKANINSNDAGYRNIHHEDSPWSEYVSDFITYAKPHTIKAVSHQLDESSAAAYLEVDGKIVQTFGNRGHLIGVYDCKTMSIKYYDWTDTYAYEIKKTSVESIWANALSIAGPTDIVYVLSWDATTRSDSARNSCLSVGGHTGYGTWGATRYAHALIGKVGLGANNGYESINNGGSASVVEAKFTSDGLVCSTWMDSGKNHLYEPDSSFTYEHPREFYKVEVPAEEYWRWKYLLKNMKSLWDSCSFTFTDTNTADFTLSVKTTGADAEINPNSSLSINYELKNYSSPDFYWHIGKIENVSDKDASIKRIFADTKNIHCVECDFINIDDISYAFYQCGQFDHIIAKMHGCTIAQYTFAECANIKTIEAVSDTITDAQFMCYNCPELVTYDLTGMTALKDATSMFEKCPSLSTEQFKQNTKLPDCLEIAKRMFAECSIAEIEGNWVPRNASSSFQNYTEISHGVQEKDWENRLEKDGWSFPSHLYSAYQMFEGNPIKKISYLKLNEKADNSWLFQNCSELTTIDFSYLNVDAYDNGKYTGIFDGCSLKKENVIWLPISIGSDFDLAQTGIKYGKNEAPTLFWVDDYWCEVDHSGFVEYQHIRRPAYEKVYKEHYGDILIKFWSHPHVHSAEMRGYNELHDTTVWYDKDSYGHGIYPTSWEDN